ncbi:tRNA methyltransferase 10 homolog C [Discoglossus pictus]
MRFIRTFLRTIRFSGFHSLVQDGGNRWMFLRCPQQFSQCRTLRYSQHLRAEDSDAREKLDLEEWKNIMRSGAQESKNEQESEIQEGSSLAAMRELVEMWRLAGRSVPEEITEDQLQSLMELQTKSARKKYLKFLSIKETLKKNRKEKKDEMKKAKKEAWEQQEPTEEKTEMKNTFLIHIFERSMDNYHRWRAAQSMIFGQPLVFDMVYDNYMSRIELDNTVNQLMESEGWNRRSANPFHIHFCSLQPDGPYHKELMRRYTGAFDNLFITATEKRHIDIFPREQLVYLTADSPTELKTFDPNKVYIVGSLVDKSQQTGLSLANAKRLNLSTARLPLDRYLKWDIGAKNLTLDQMIRILITLKDTGDWEKALSYVPTRKHEGFVPSTPFQKKYIPKNTKIYEFGKRNTFIKPEKDRVSHKTAQNRWWEQKD